MNTNELGQLKDIETLTEQRDKWRKMYAELAEELETRVAAAVAAEREACAKIAEKRSTGLTTYEVLLTSDLARSIAKAIRARNP